jgi:hypothetical protein
VVKSHAPGRRRPAFELTIEEREHMGKGLTVLVAVALVLTVTAAASGRVQRLITGRDIENNTVASADIKNNTIVRKDLNRRLVASLRGPRGPRGPAGVRGAKGATGAAGVNGLNGKSAFDTVPAGVTIRGVVGLDVDAANPGGDWGTLETMGMPGASPLDDAHVAINILGWVNLGGNTPPTSTDTSPGCTGTPVNPTAPSGMVCIYVLHSDNAQDLFGYGVDSEQGFKLNFTNVLAGDSFVDATWAYTG